MMSRSGNSVHIKGAARLLRNSISILVVALMVGSANVTAAQPQDFDPDFYTSALTGLDIEVAGPGYAITDVTLQHYPTGGGEIITIDSETTPSSLEVSFFDDADTPQDTIGIYLSSLEGVAAEFEVIDRGVDGDYHYGLARLVYDSVELFYYVQVYEDLDGNTDLFEAILSSELALADDVAQAQVEVTIDGVPFLENVDPAELHGVISSGGSLTPAEEAATPTQPLATVSLTQTNTDVSIGPDFIFVGDPEVEGAIESIVVRGPETESLVAVGQTGDAPEVVLGDFAAGVTSVSAEAELVGEAEGSWQLLWIPRDDGSSAYLLIVVDMDLVPGAEVLHAHELPSDTAAGSIITIRDQVFISDQVLIADQEMEQVINLIDDHGGIDAGSDSIETTEPSEEDVDDDRTSDPREDARLPDSSDETDAGLGNTSETSGTPGETGVATEEATSEAGGGAGVLTDSSWQGGVHGHLIEWDPATWFVDVDFEGDLISDEEFLEDTIVLQSQSSTGTSWMYISVLGGDVSTPHEYLDYWESDDYLTTFTETGADVEVLEVRTRDGNGAILFRITDADGAEFLVVRQAVALDDGTVMLTTLDVPAADMPELYGDAQGVTLDGEAVLSVFSESQIQRVIAD